MDLDPELEVTLSDGQEAVTFQILAVHGPSEAWAITEPRAPFRVVLNRAEAIDTRLRLDTEIGARLAAGWVPVDAGPAGARCGPPTPLPPDLALQLGHVLEVLGRERAALQAVDPSGVLWAACVTFRRQARRVGVAAAGARLARAQRERQLGALAERAGNMPAAILHYRAAVAAHAGAGVKRRLAQLERYWPPGESRGTLPTSGGIGLPHVPIRTASRSRDDARDRPRTINRAPAQNEEQRTMAKKSGSKVQLVCRIDSALHAKVRAQAARAGQTLTTFITRALEKATGSRSAMVAR